VTFNCTVITNRVDPPAYGVYARGAGVFCVAGSIVSNCVISRNSNYGNWLRKGGGAYFDRGGLITDCELSFNACAGYGGGACLDYGGMLDRAILRGNKGGSGDGALVDRAGLIANSSVYENRGQGLYCNHGGSIINCTVARNAAEGISVRGTVDVYNTIAYLNSGVNLSRDSAVDVLYCCTTPATTGDGNISDDPRFFNAAGGDFRLRDTSPCIDMGTNALTYGDWDIEGNPRILDGVVDMGAYEWVPEPGAALAAAVGIAAVIRRHSLLS
jgi:hypothetical protein